MKTWKILTTVTLAVIAVALTLTSAYAYMGGRVATQYGTGVPTAYGYGGMMGGGMMGGYGYYAPPVTGYPTTTVPTQPGTTTAYPSYYGGMGCGGMRGRYGYTTPPYAVPTTATPINITTAVTTARNFVASLNNANLAVTHVEEYTLNFYVQVKEVSTGTGAFELLIDKYTGAIGPEMGPNMMWNTKYGAMGAYIGTPTTTMTVTVDQAKANAQQYLNSYLPGATVGDVTAFPGYYTIEVLSAGKTYGMLSVNGFTGQVWFHNWHGTFIQETSL
ncbi:MAG: hypothetical protein ACE14S_10255 [Candidatus Bathyarchaeia archaeon]